MINEYETQQYVREHQPRKRHYREAYAAGPITGLTHAEASSWRDDPLLHHCLERIGWRLRSPMRDKEHLARMGGPLPARVPDPEIEKFEVDRDLSDIDECDAVFMNLLGAERVSIGTMCELGYAHALEKPIVVVQSTDDEVHDHLFVSQMSTVIVPTIGDAITELKRLYEPAYA